MFFLLWHVLEDCTEFPVVGGWVQEGVLSCGFGALRSAVFIHAGRLIRIASVISNESINAAVDFKLFPC